MVSCGGTRVRCRGTRVRCRGNWLGVGVIC